MKLLEVEGKVIGEPTPKIEVSVPLSVTEQVYTYYLEGRSVHVCTQ